MPRSIFGSISYAILLGLCCCLPRLAAAQDYGSCMQACSCVGGPGVDPTSCRIACQSRCSMEDAVRQSRRPTAPAQPRRLENNEPFTPLTTETVELVGVSADAFDSLDITDAIYPAVKGLHDHGQKVLKCIYKSDGYKIFYFWYRTVPTEIKEYQVRANRGQLAYLGMKSLTKCPDTSHAALALEWQNRAEAGYPPR